MVALDLEAIVVGAADADVAVANSVQEARRVLGDAAFDAALLDIDVLDGKTFGLAQHAGGARHALRLRLRRAAGGCAAAAAPGALPAQAL